ncbi:MAG: 4Fe-4S dicluster domain-containing protein [Oscillospiraceae bacterium]|nr:4Fe-4S dicluster domain-containing protein [Oscillospiraceae bacterium]
MFRLPVERLDELFAMVSAAQTLYIPADGKDSRAHYTKWEEGIKLSNALNTVRSAKDFFFPQTTNLCDFNKKDKEIEIIDNRTESEDFVVFGVRACDTRSFTILDKVFLVDPVDSYYATRREHGTVVTLACTEPEETCFCGVFGIDAASPEGDAACWIADGYLYITANTEKGEKFISLVSSLLEESSDEAVEAQKKATAEIMSRLPFNDIDTSYFRKNTLLEIFNSDHWKKLSEACIGCGTCTFVCPTCQCYDIKDYDTGCGIKRYRTWDSCMYSDFTKTAGGNPRTSQVERFRQRFMHKLVYFPDNNNEEFGCVGCGRCISRCPISMNIVKVIKTFGEVQ